MQEAPIIYARHYSSMPLPMYRERERIFKESMPGAVLAQYNSYIGE